MERSGSHGNTMVSKCESKTSGQLVFSLLSKAKQQGQGQGQGRHGQGQVDLKVYPGQKWSTIPKAKTLCIAK